MRRLLLTLAAALCLSITLAPQLYSQATAAFNQRDDKYRLLGLKRAKESYELLKSEYDRQKNLFDRQLITQQELEMAKSRLSDAEVNYQQSLLAVLFEEQYISVRSAIKYYAKDGARHVRITLDNSSGGSAEFQKLLNIDDELFRSLQPDVIPNVYVSVLNDQGAIISQPYEAKIPELRHGAPQTIDFTLLQDLDAVSVYLIYGNGSQRTMKIFLQKDASSNRVAVQSEQFSQEVELGKTATFDLTLELFSGVGNTFSLEVANLPRSISRFFKDPAGQARLSQVKFTESTHTKRAALEISLPDRPSDEIVMDQPVLFYVVILPHDRAAEFKEIQTRVWTQAELEALDVGLVRLELMPRGKGKLLIRSNQLFHAIHDDESVSFTVDCVNEGSDRLDNVEIKADVPLNWSKTIEPAVLPSLAIGEEGRVAFTFTPPPDIAAGKYEVRLRSSGMSAGQPVVGEDKTVTIEILPSSNVIGIALVVLLILGLVAAVVVFGIRLSRK
jgi:hypothetical protein